MNYYKSPLDYINRTPYIHKYEELNDNKMTLKEKKKSNILEASRYANPNEIVSVIDSYIISNFNKSA